MDTLNSGDGDCAIFVEKSKEKLANIEQLILALSSTVEEPEKVREMLHSAYSISGEAPALGLASVQKAFHLLVDACQILLESKLPVDRQVQDLFLRAHDLLTLLINRLEISLSLWEDEIIPILEMTQTHFQKLFDCLQQKNNQKKCADSQENLCSKESRQGRSSSTTTPGTLQPRHDLKIAQIAKKAANLIFQFSKQFPLEEQYALTEPIRYSSRFVCVHLIEALRKSRSQTEFFSKLNDVEIEVAKTQTWLELAVRCNYIDLAAAKVIYQSYDWVLAHLNKIGKQDERLELLASARKA